jgi:hypothetical protein
MVAAGHHQAAHELTGRGEQIVGVADTGIDWDNCFFWESAYSQVRLRWQAARERNAQPITAPTHAQRHPTCGNQAAVPRNTSQVSPLPPTLRLLNASCAHPACPDHSHYARLSHVDETCQPWKALLTRTSLAEQQIAVHSRDSAAGCSYIAAHQGPSRTICPRRHFPNTAGHHPSIMSTRLGGMSRRAWCVCTRKYARGGVQR